MTNVLSALLLVTLATNESRIHTSPAGDMLACRRVVERVYSVTWTENGTNHTAEVKRVAISTNHWLLKQEWVPVTEKPERVPLGVADKIMPPKR